MIKFFPFLFFLIAQITFGQTNGVAKKRLRQNFKNKDSFARQWMTCNNDSLFYKSDTLYFYDSLNYNSCKKYIIWGFVSPQKFYQIEGESFNSYGTVKVIMNDDWCKIKIFKKNKETYVRVYKKKIY